MTISEAILPSTEPDWCLDRLTETGDLFWRRDSSKVKFRCEVQVLEFEKDPNEYNSHWPRGHRRYCYDGETSNPVIAIATCVGAIVITILLPWFMVGESNIIEVW